MQPLCGKRRLQFSIPSWLPFCGGLFCGLQIPLKLCISNLNPGNIKKGRDYWYFTKNTDPETGKEVSRTYVGGITCAWPNVTVNHEPKSQKNELIYSNGKIVGAKAIVEYRFYTHTTLGENNHIVMKTGDVFSDGHVVTEKEESTYEKHELGHEFYNECVSYDEIEETGTFECTVKISGTMSIDKRTKILRAYP